MLDLVQRMQQVIDLSSTRLDLTGSTELQHDHAAQLDAIAEELRQPFTELIQRISAPYGAELDWWVTPLACRNTYICSLFLRLCRVILVQRVIGKSQINEVVVDTPALAYLLRNTLPSSVQVLCTVTAMHWRLRGAMTIIRRLSIALYTCVGKFCFSKLILSVKRNSPSEPIVVINTVIYPESIQAGILRDRHYPGLLDNLTEPEQQRIYWAPSYYGVLNYFRLFQQLRTCKNNLLLAEDYLYLTDYVFAISHILRAGRLLPKCEFMGMDITVLVREAYTENLANLGSIAGLLRYRFVNRLHNAGIRLHHVVEWHENQEIDHGAVAGWRTFYPETQVVGYQGFLATRTYLCMYPMALEKTLNLLPQTLAVIGSAMIGQAKEFCPDMQVMAAPAFRFQAAWRNRSSEPDNEWFTILVPLPLLKSECIAILTMVKQAAKMIEGSAQRPCRLWIKPHPAWRRKDIDNIVPTLPQNFRVIDGSFDEAMDGADTLVSSASSTCVQAVAQGIPVAIVSRSGFPTKNPIPSFVDTRLWTVCHTASDLAVALARYANFGIDDKKKLMNLACGYRTALFEPVTPGSVRSLLGFKQ